MKPELIAQLAELRQQMEEALRDWHARRATVCEHTQLIEYGAAVDAMLKAVDEHPVLEIRPYYPTEDAYQAADKAVWRHRQRADDAEARAAALTAERDAEREQRERAESECERLRRRAAHLQERYAELQDYELGIKSLTAADGSIDLDLHMAHEMMRIYVAAMSKILDEEGGPNYAELTYKLAGTLDRYTLTIRRPNGKSPHEAREAAEQRAAQAENEAAVAESERDELRRRHEVALEAVSEQHDVTGAETGECFPTCLACRVETALKGNRRVEQSGGIPNDAYRPGDTPKGM